MARKRNFDLGEPSNEQYGTPETSQLTENSNEEFDANNGEVIEENDVSYHRDVGNGNSNFINPDSSVTGLNKEEQRDPTRIKVTISDQKTPIVVLFGPPACGKTMTMVRLTRYLNSQGYNVSPIKSFRPSDDSHYQDMCDGFNAMINSDDAAKSTNQISFMLLKVLNNGKTICQILEAPGEHYFNPPKSDFLPYINTIIASNNPKIWLIFVESDWKDASDRRNYVACINTLKKNMKSKDKTVFIFNKIDETDYIIDRKHINNIAARKGIEDLYEGIFSLFRNQNPIIKFFKKYNFEFTPFSSGKYSVAQDGGQVFTAGDDAFPRRLWKILLKKING